MTRAVVDTAEVKEGFFKFTGKVEEPRLVYMKLDASREAVMILEGGDLKFNPESQTFTGTPLNDNIAKLNLEGLKLVDLYSSRVNEISLNENLSDDEIVLEVGKLEDEMLTKMTPILINAYVGNEDNLLGYYILDISKGILPSEDFATMVSASGSKLRSYKFVKDELAFVNNKGKIIEIDDKIDFEASLTNGTVQKFSDVVGKGKYILVDFWASWCGPCLKEVPTLKKVYEEYAGDNFDVLGVAVWDAESDSEASIKSEGMPWRQILNTGDIAAKAFGFSSIPQIMLFAPDGTLIKKGLRGDNIVTAVKEALGK